MRVLVRSCRLGAGVFVNKHDRNLPAVVAAVAVLALLGGGSFSSRAQAF